MRRLMKSGISFLLAAGSTLSAQTDRMTTAYGVSWTGSTLTAEIHPSLLDVASPVTRVVIIAPAESDSASDRATAALIRQLEEASRTWRADFPQVSLSFVTAPPIHAAAVRQDFPPTGRAYGVPATSDAHYLWRWLGMVAPDVVVEIRPGEQTAWTRPDSDQLDFTFAQPLSAAPDTNPRSLPSALASRAVCEVAPIPALSLDAVSPADLQPLLEALQQQPVRSPARQELQRRRSRSPLELAGELSTHYGRQLSEIAYIPTLALIGRLRLADLTGDATHRQDVERLAQPWLSGERSSLPAPSNGSQQAGHLLFGELAARTGDPRYLSLLQVPTELAFDEEGQLREVMPAHDQMSDAIFLGTPLLAQTARLTGDLRYREMALRHLRFMVKLNERPDGLHQHSPVDPSATAWGRGNGFVTMGLALTLSELPEDSPEFLEVLSVFQKHLSALLPHQDEMGMWHQVIDHPGSYREYTVTCMTSFAMVRGLRRGWLDRTTYEPVVRRAWRAIQQRTASDGGLVDVCTGTGKMPSRQAYLDRPAILGRDDRGGAMALMVTTELAYAAREGALTLP